MIMAMTKPPTTKRRHVSLASFVDDDPWNRYCEKNHISRKRLEDILERGTLPTLRTSAQLMNLLATGDIGGVAEAIAEVCRERQAL